MEQCGKKRGKVLSLHLSSYAGNGQMWAFKSIHHPEDGDETWFQNLNHCHDFYEIAVVVRGRGKHWRDGREEMLYPGNVFMLPPGEPHFYEYSEMLVLQTFMISPKLFEVFRGQLMSIPGFVKLFDRNDHSPKILDSSTMAELDILLNTIAQENRRKEPGGELFIIAKMIDVLVTISRNIQGAETCARPDSNIGPAVAYMWRHFHEELKISKLAQLVNLSESSFYRKFVMEFRMAPSIYLQKLRIRKAMEFLIRSDMTINEVSNTCGFNDPLYFSRQFRKFTGSSPREYRVKEHGSLQVVYGQSGTAVDFDFITLQER